MTIVQAENILISFFMQSDVFDAIEDTLNVVPKDSTTKELDSAVIEGALFALEKKGVIAQVRINGDSNAERAGWALVKPFVMQSRTLELSWSTLHTMVQTINGYSEMRGGSGTIVDYFTMDENAVVGLCQIIGQLSEMLSPEQTDDKRPE